MQHTCKFLIYQLIAIQKIWEKNVPKDRDYENMGNKEGTLLAITVNSRKISRLVDTFGRMPYNKLFEPFHCKNLPSMLLLF